MIIVSEVTVVLDERVRLLGALLAVSRWPDMEQAQQPHAVHPQSKMTKHFMEEVTAEAKETAVARLNEALAAGVSLREIYTAVLQSDWPALKPPAQLPSAFQDGVFHSKLAVLAAQSDLANELWAKPDEDWMEAKAELAEIFVDVALAEFLGRVCGKAVDKPITIVPTLTYPMLDSVVADTAVAYYIIMPPPKAWGESPPWPFRDGYEWVLGEACRELLHHLLAAPLAGVDAERVALLKHGAATLFLEEAMSEEASLAYLVRAKRQYSLPRLPVFVEQLRLCLQNSQQDVLDLLS